MMNYMILGASRGLGDAFVRGLPEDGDTVWMISRSRPDSLALNDGVQRIWIEADLSLKSASQQIAKSVKDMPIDVLIYNAGIWETDGWQSHYDFEKDNPEEIANIIQVNTTSAILCLQKLIPNLKKSTNAKVILIGSTDGLENNVSKQPAYVASKFGIRGVAYALRESLREYGIAVTCMNPGSLGTGIPYEEGIEKAITRYQGTCIPLQDIVLLAKTITKLSKATCVKEINIPAMMDRNM
ncbi:SDR family NAD(P)-dependent oxidoreductase [Pseudoneobacillus sp. C159]